MELFLNLVRFSVQAAIVVIGILIVCGFLFSLTQKSKDTSRLKLKSRNSTLKKYKNKMESILLSKKDLKKNHKKVKKEDTKLMDRPRAFVINFEGDIKASAVDQLREEVTAILSVATAKDQVIAKIESPGGIVHGYGLAASQLQRLRDQKIPLVACIDKVAASGGYMMASVANKIYGAPFAIVGSIGVVASLPNFNKILEKNDVDYLEITAGEYKRTVTTLGKVTDQGLDKFKSQIEDIHGLFKKHVQDARPQMDIKKVATGEYWFGQQALELGLIDDLQTSDALICNLAQTHHVVEVSIKEKMGLKEKLAEGLGSAFSQTLNRILTRFYGPQFMG